MLRPVIPPRLLRTRTIPATPRPLLQDGEVKEPPVPPAPCQPSTPVSPWHKLRAWPNARQWVQARPDTPRMPPPLPQLEPFSPSRNEPPPPSSEEDSSDSEAERQLRRASGAPLATRRLQDSPGWWGAAGDPLLEAQPGVTTRAAARRMETEDKGTAEVPS